MIDSGSTYVYGDQPTTCPKCGARTLIIADFSHTKTHRQVHECRCNYIFIIEEDEE